MTRHIINRYRETIMDEFMNEIFQYAGMIIIPVHENDGRAVGRRSEDVGGKGKSVSNEGAKKMVDSRDIQTVVSKILTYPV